MTAGLLPAPCIARTHPPTLHWPWPHPLYSPTLALASPPVQPYTGLGLTPCTALHWPWPHPLYSPTLALASPPAPHLLQGCQPEDLPPQLLQKMASLLAAEGLLVQVG